MESVVVVLVLLHIHQSGIQAQVMCHITNVVSVPPVQVPSPFLLEPPRCSSITKVLTTLLAEIDTTIKAISGTLLTYQAEAKFMEGVVRYRLGAQCSRSSAFI